MNTLKLSFVIEAVDRTTAIARSINKRIEGLTAVPRYLNNRAASIYGGSNEIQRDIIARLVLGL